MKERVVYGKHAVLEAIEAGQRIRRLYVATRSNAARDPRLAKALATQNVKVSESPREALDRLAEGGRHQGIVAVLSGGFGYWKLSDLLERFSVSLLRNDLPDEGYCLRCAAYIVDECPVASLCGGCPYQKVRGVHSNRGETSNKDVAKETS